MGVEYISLTQSIREVIPFLSLMKEIEFVLKLQGETPTALCSIFENLVIVYKDNQGAIALTVFRKYDLAQRTSQSSIITSTVFP